MDKQDCNYNPISEEMVKVFRYNYQLADGGHIESWAHNGITQHLCIPKHLAGLLRKFLDENDLLYHHVKEYQVPLVSWNQKVYGFQTVSNILLYGIPKRQRTGVMPVGVAMSNPATNQVLVEELVPVNEKGEPNDAALPDYLRQTSEHILYHESTCGLTGRPWRAV